MATYRQMLMDRRWQRKRLEVFNAANWHCVNCTDKDETVPLHAHHTLYLPGRAPWEYADGEIVSICDPCHAQEHGKRESDPELAELEHRIREAHAAGRWDEMMELAARAQELIDNGAFYRGLT